MANYDFTYTGAEIQAILDTAKKLKDSGYIFLGVATPSTNPGTPTQKVYYEAKQAGTYTNFGGVVLPDGISLLKWNGSWTSETVMCGDGGVFDISVYKSSGGTLAKYTDLAAALGTNGANIPQSLRKGGMSVKFVQSSDNYYQQFRCKTQSFSVNPEDWYFEGNTRLVENPEYADALLDNNQNVISAITSKGVKEEFLPTTHKNSVKFEKDVELGEDANADNFKVREDFEAKNVEVEENLEVGGKVSAPDVETSTNYNIDNEEFADLLLDSKKNIIESRGKDGKKTFYGPVEFKGNVKFDKEPKIIKSEVSKKLASPRKTLLNPFGSTFQNNKPYTENIADGVYDIFKKEGICLLRDYATVALQDAYDRNIDILAMSTAFVHFTPVTNEVLNHIAELISFYDGNEHTIDGTTIKTKVDYWQVCNEPDLEYSGIASDAEVFFNNFKTVYKLIKSIRPECKVLFGDFSRIGSNFFTDISTIRDSDGKAIWDYCDIISFHSYGDGSVLPELTSYKQLCDTTYSINEYSHLKDKPVWLTEHGTQPFTLQNEEDTRKKILPKMSLECLSYGIEKIFIYKLVEYNMFVTDARNNYYGLVSPNYKCAYAGFFYNDSQKSSLTPDGLLDKTYIYPENSIPNIQLGRLSIEEIMSNGIAINGKGFTANKVYIASMDSPMVFSEVRELWSGTVIMNGENYLTIDGLDFLPTDKNYYLVVDISDITMTDTDIASYTFKPSFYSMKMLASLFTNECSVPNISSNSKYTIVSWKIANGLTNYAIWSISGISVNVSIGVDENAILYDVVGNKLSEIPSVITDSPIYITNTDSINLN